MEIYKLSDQIPDRRPIRLTNKHKYDKMNSLAAQSAQLSDPQGNYGNQGASLTITALRQGVKRLNRVNVFINNQYSFSLDIAQVVDFKLSIGKSITDGDLQQYKKASAFGKEYQKALEWALIRPRSLEELRNYLQRRQNQNDYKDRQREWKQEREVADLIAKGEEVDAARLQKHLAHARAGEQNQEKYDFTDLILQRLAERGYVDDQKFARYYVENRLTKKGISRRRLEQELSKKGIRKDIIDEVLSNTNRTDVSEIQKIIAKKRSRYDDEKLIGYLCRQGFSYDLARTEVSKAGNNNIAWK